MRRNDDTTPIVFMIFAAICVIIMVIAGIYTQIYCARWESHPVEHTRCRTIDNHTTCTTRMEQESTCVEWRE